MRVARACRSERGAQQAFVYRGGEDGTAPSLCAATARARARCPLTESGEHAVDRARAKVARASLTQGTDCDTTKCRSTLHSTRARLSAGSARGGARAPCAPDGRDAIDWARVSVAGLRIRKRRAVTTAVIRHGLHHARARPQPAAAAHGTRRPHAPRRNCAVHGTRVCVARLSLGEERAHEATVARLRGDRARAALRAGSARCGARGPCRPG